MRREQQLRKTFRLSKQKVQEIADSHYRKAMKHVANKNKLESERLLKSTQQLNISSQCTFTPKINKKSQHLNSFNQEMSHDRLIKWGKVHEEAKRFNSIVLSIEKEFSKSQEKILNCRSDMDNSVAVPILGPQLKTKKNHAFIKGQQQYYLNKTRAAYLKSGKQFYYEPPSIKSGALSSSLALD